MEKMMNEIKDILERLGQLESMKHSVMEFAKKLKEDEDEFLVKYLNFSKADREVHVFEFIRRALEKEHIK